jgi:RimJ/RimL family protein N-acetyltransferase
MAQNCVIEDLSVAFAADIMRWKNDKSLSELILSNYQTTTIEEAENWIFRNSTDKNQVLKGIFVVINAQKILVGIVRLMYIDTKNKHAEFGIYIGDSQHRGKGYGQIATQLIVDEAFVKQGLHKVYLKVDESNIAAIKSYQKVGFEIDGRLKDHVFDGTNYKTLLLMSVIEKINL